MLFETHLPFSSSRLPSESLHQWSQSFTNKSNVSRLFASSPLLTTADRLTSIIASQLESCTSDTYIIVSQPGVSVADYSGLGTAPHLRRNILGDDLTIRSSLTVNEVLGQIDVDGLSRVVQDKCEAGHLRIDASSKHDGRRRKTIKEEPLANRWIIAAGSFTIADEMRPRVINLDFPLLPDGAERAQKLVENGTISTSLWRVWCWPPQMRS